MAAPLHWQFVLCETQHDKEDEEVFRPRSLSATFILRIIKYESYYVTVARLHCICSDFVSLSFSSARHCLVDTD